MAGIIPTFTNVLDYAFYPRSVAVVGASDQHSSFGYHFLRHLIHYKYAGALYPVNPSRDVVQGLKSYCDLRSVPGDVDLVICCLPAGRVPAMLDDCPARRVKIVHLFTGRLTETGRPEAKELEEQIRAKARQLGIRLLGPNCMGVYNPLQGLSFGYNFPTEGGSVGILSQSGGAATQIIQQGMLRGLRFSKAVSYGNALDIDESELIDYLAADESTSVIAAYLEGTCDGAKLLAAMERACVKKPVVLIKGGRDAVGSRTTYSHTAAIAGSSHVWRTAVRQAGAVEARNLDEMANMLVLFTRLPPVTGKKVGIMGGSGGRCVLSADAALEAGLTVPPISMALREQFRAVVPDYWDWLDNPVDYSILGDSVMKGSDLSQVYSRSPEIDLLIMQVSEESPMDDDVWVHRVRSEAANMIGLTEAADKPVIGILSGARPCSDDLDNIRWKTLLEQRSVLVRAGVPTFNNIDEAAYALNKYVDYWRHREAVAGQSGK